MYSLCPIEPEPRPPVAFRVCHRAENPSPVNRRAEACAPTSLVKRTAPRWIAPSPSGAAIPSAGNETNPAGEEDKQRVASQRSFGVGPFGQVLLCFPSNARAVSAFLSNSRAVLRPLKAERRRRKKSQAPDRGCKSLLQLFFEGWAFWRSTAHKEECAVFPMDVFLGGTGNSNHPEKVCAVYPTYTGGSGNLSPFAPHVEVSVTDAQKPWRVPTAMDGSDFAQLRASVWWMCQHRDTKATPPQKRGARVA